MKNTNDSNNGIGALNFRSHKKKARKREAEKEGGERGRERERERERENKVLPAARRSEF